MAGVSVTATSTATSLSTSTVSSTTGDYTIPLLRAGTYDVTVTTFPEDSTGMDEHGDNEVEIKQYSHTKRTALLLKPGPGATV